MKKLILTIAVVAVSLHAWHGGWRRGGWGWGGPVWGPSFGVTIPVGGGSSGPKMIAPAGDPYNTYMRLFPKANPFKNSNAYQQWLYTNYSEADANRWWGVFANRYNTYQANKPKPSAYFSVGTGGYYGPYWGPYWGPAYGGGVGFSVGF